MKNRSILGISVAIVATLLALSVRDTWTIDPDAAAYVGLGRALASGDGYTLEGPSGSLHGKYPPGLPLVIAGLTRVAGPEAYDLFHLALVALLVAALVIVHGLARRLGLGPAPALVVALCTGLSQTFFDLSVVYIRTEVPFLALSMGALRLLLGPTLPSEGEGPRPLSLGRFLSSAALLLGAVLIRTAGVALAIVPAWRLVARGSTLRVRGQSAVLVAVAIVPVLAWQPVTGWVTGTPSAEGERTSYAAEFLASEPRDLTKVVQIDNPRLDGRGLVRRVTGNVEVLARACATLLTNVDRAAHRLPVGALLLLLVAAGSLSMLTRGSGPREAGLYLLAACGLYLVWPFNQQERFYAPLLPLMLIAAGSGVVHAWRTAARAAESSAGRTLLRVIALAMLALLLAQSSDQPVLLERWSYAYAGLLAASLVLVILLFRWSQPGRWPRPHPALLGLLVLVFAAPFGQRMVRDWPARCAAFEARRAEAPVGGALQRIDTHPLLEQAALFLRDGTPVDATVMTDVPKMMAIMADRRCLPFVFSADPPRVHAEGADYVFYTRELPAADAALAATAAEFDVALDLEDAGGTTVASIYTTRAP